MGVVIQIVGLAAGDITGAEGKYVKEYTPSGFGGRGDLVVTDEIADAKLYPDLVAAWEEYKRVSDTHPWRSDGKPNRPLTAFTVSMQNV
jgi:hypothetical protein